MEPVYPDILNEHGQREDIRTVRWRKGYPIVERLGAQGFVRSTFDGVLYVFTDTFDRAHVYDAKQLMALDRRKG